jgi:hypothetical protein
MPKLPSPTALDATTSIRRLELFRLSTVERRGHQLGGHGVEHRIAGGNSIRTRPSIAFAAERWLLADTEVMGSAARTIATHILYVSM